MNCIIDGCRRPRKYRLLCSLHYQRQRAGSPLEAPVRQLTSSLRGLSLEERFVAQHQRGPHCWLWTGATDRDGYGVIRGDGGKQMRAARVSYELYRGPLSDDTMVLHTCHVPACVRPSHLYLGDHAQNMLDRGHAGRQTRGAAHWCARLDDSTVRTLREALATGARPMDLAAEFDLSRSTIYAIASRRSWKHVP